MFTAAAGGAVPPISSWVDTVGKKIGRDVQRRASTLISDASSSFFAAIGSPNGKHEPELYSDTSSSPSRTPSSLASSLSLMDEEDEDEAVGQHRGKILDPVVISPGGFNSAIQEEPEEWNW